MVGKSKFDLPTPKKLETYYNRIKSGEKRVMVEEMAVEKSLPEGQITIKDFDQKIKQQRHAEHDPIQDHVEKFTDQMY